MTMADGQILGEFEQLVLLGVLHCGAEAYGVPICRELQTRARRRVSLGAVYKTLDRLEQKRMVRSTVGPATAERGGRRKRIYTVTDLGLKALRTSLGAVARMWNGLETVLGLP
jgi:PadR family transcriptional regulator, regulatory protein PadR